MTKFDTRFALKLSAVLTWAVLALPLAAQQDVSPEHFDQKPGAARSHKAALPHQAATARRKKSAGKQDTTAAKAKRKAPAASALTADAARRSDSL